MSLSQFAISPHDVSAYRCLQLITEKKLLQSPMLTVTQSIKLFIIKAEKMGDFVDDGNLDLLK
jgi:hypothetical protein